MRTMRKKTNLSAIKKLIRKVLWSTALIAALASAVVMSCPSNAAALPETLHEEKSNEIITRGVVLERVKSITTEGWLTYDLLRVNLKDPFIYFESLYNQLSLTALTTVPELAKGAGAVAAVNASFFTSQNSTSYPIGTSMKNGVIDTAQGYMNLSEEVIGSITIDDAKNMLFGYVNPTITLYGHDDKTLWIDIYNKPGGSFDYAGFAIYDRKFRQFSVGASKNYPDIVELVVDNGKVREIRVGEPAIEIPVNGFVVVARESLSGKTLLEEAFSVGRDCRFQVALTPTLEGATTHLDGSSILLKDGAIPSQFSYNPKDIASRNPRTMIGITQDRSEALIVAVDGRSGASIGLNTLESAEFMRSLGAYEALNFDGGGSTTMVARNPSKNALELINVPSDKSSRKISTALGVFTNAPRAAIGRIEIEADSYDVFAGSGRKFTAKAFDRYDNPIEINQNDIVWSTDNIRGKFTDGVLTPTRPSEGTVRARAGRVRAEINVRSLEAPGQIILDSGRLVDLNAGATRQFLATGKTVDGFSAPISGSDIEWRVFGDIGTIDGAGLFKRAGTGEGYISASFGGATAYCKIAARPGGPDAAKPIETPQDTRIVDPAAKTTDYSAANGSYRFAVLGTRTAAAWESELKTIEEKSAAAAASKAGADDSKKLSEKEKQAAEKSAADARKTKVATLIEAAGKQFSARVNNYVDFGVFAGFGEWAGATSFKKNMVGTDYSFVSYDGDALGIGDSRFVKLSTVGGSVRSGGKTQWRMFINAIKDFRGKNLFVALAQSPSTLTDKLESSLFRSLLAKYSMENGFNAYVFYPGATDTVWIEDGVRYFSLAGLTSSDLNAAKIVDSNYLLVTVVNGEVTYAYRKLAN